MDAISYSYADKQAKRIKKFIENPDSNSGIVTVPKVIGAGENITIPAGRVAVLPNVQVDGTLNIEGEVFIPSGSTFGDLEDQLATKADTSYVNSKYSGFKNYIINGNFDIWQRGDSFSPAGYSYFFTADRWWVDWSDTATGLSASKQPGLVGKNSLYTTRTGGAKMQIYQMVENQGNLSNKIFTFSALVRSTYNGTIFFKIADGRSASNFIYRQTPVTLDGDNKLKKIVFTVQLGQVSDNALFVGLETSCTDLYIERVQMEEGSVATPFEHRPIGLELSLCQRYYEITKFALYNSFSETKTIGLGVNYCVQKRIVPTFTLLSGVSITGHNPDVRGLTVYATISPGYWLQASYAVSAEL